MIFVAASFFSDMFPGKLLFVLEITSLDVLIEPIVKHVVSFETSFQEKEPKAKIRKLRRWERSTEFL